MLLSFGSVIVLQITGPLSMKFWWIRQSAVEYMMPWKPAATWPL
jgi:hypothetical protein